MDDLKTLVKKKDIYLIVIPKSELEKMHKVSNNVGIYSRLNIQSVTRLLDLLVEQLPNPRPMDYSPRNKHPKH